MIAGGGELVLAREAFEVLARALAEPALGTLAELVKYRQDTIRLASTLDAKLRLEAEETERRRIQSYYSFYESIGELAVTVERGRRELIQSHFMQVCEFLRGIVDHLNDQQAKLDDSVLKEANLSPGQWSYIHHRTVAIKTERSEILRLVSVLSGSFTIALKTISSDLSQTNKSLVAIARAVKRYDY
jgi:hypothetical protein